MDLSGYGLSPEREQAAELELFSDPAALTAPPCAASLPSAARHVPHHFHRPRLCPS